ncbi:hypothetical protein CRE_08339 [Caenorhabditis remanei]|uniref:Uncharacterized protein n=1 Tax=Caenorhabditis remanei TaxID=31234 RepID=E3MPH5_CAERE|nr:hypothetical protein CRE_08339 [Caenorhabditis remanei]
MNVDDDEFMDDDFDDVLDDEFEGLFEIEQPVLIVEQEGLGLEADDMTLTSPEIVHFSNTEQPSEDGGAEKPLNKIVREAILLVTAATLQAGAVATLADTFLCFDEVTHASTKRKLKSIGKRIKAHDSIWLFMNALFEIPSILLKHGGGEIFGKDLLAEAYYLGSSAFSKGEKAREKCNNLSAETFTRLERMLEQGQVVVEDRDRRCVFAATYADSFLKFYEDIKNLSIKTLDSIKMALSTSLMETNGKEEEIATLKQNVEDLQQKVKNVKRVEDIMKEITKLKAQDKTTANGATITESIANREAAGKRLTKIAKMVKKLDADSEVRRWLDDVVCMDRAGHNCTSNHRGHQGSHLLDLALEDLSRFKNNSKALFQYVKTRSNRVNGSYVANRQSTHLSSLEIAVQRAIAQREASNFNVRPAAPPPVSDIGVATSENVPEPSEEIVATQEETPATSSAVKPDCPDKQMLMESSSPKKKVFASRKVKKFEQATKTPVSELTKIEEDVTESTDPSTSEQSQHVSQGSSSKIDKDSEDAVEPVVKIVFNQ